MLRVICLKSSGELEVTLYDHFKMAYQRCMPKDKRAWHIMLSDAAEDAIVRAKGEPVSICWNEGEPIRIAWWIQEVHPPEKSFPALKIPEPFH
jgi:hypothetical protein